MLRLAIGLALLAFPLTLELRGELRGAELSLPVWFVFSAAALLLFVAGARDVVLELRESRAADAMRSGVLSRTSVSFVRAVVVVGLVPILLFVQGEAELERADWPPEQEILHLPKPEVLRVLSLGYRGFAADLVWLRAIGYYADHFFADRKYNWLEKYLDAVIALDPLFRTPYRYAGTVTMYNLRTITKEAVERSTHYLEQGYQRFPTDWEFPFTICSNYLFELTRFAKDEAEKRRYQETGAEFCREASVLPGALPFLGSMAGSYLTRLGKRQLARQHFRELILRTEDPKMREKLQLKYAALVSKEAARKVDDDAGRFFRQHQENYPYLATDLFLHLGPRGGDADTGKTLRAALGAAGTR